MEFLVFLLHAIFSLPGINWLWQKVLEVWQVNDTLPDGAIFDAGVITSYAATRTRLTNGSQLVLEKAISLADPNTFLFWGSFEPTNSDKEEYLKRVALLRNNPVFFGKVASANDEADDCLTKMARIFWERNEKPKKIFVASESCFCRRQRSIWLKKIRLYFPGAEVYFVSVDGREVDDLLNPMIFQRYWEVWLAFNIFFWLVYQIPPLYRAIEKINLHQPIAQKP